MKLLYFSAIAISLITVTSCTKDVGPNPDLLPKAPQGCDTITFTKHIKPIMTNYCAISGCHEPGAQSPDLTDDNTIHNQADLIKMRVIDLHNMPPVGYPAPTEEEINSIKCWLNAGAPLN